MSKPRHTAAFALALALAIAAAAHAQPSGPGGVIEAARADAAKRSGLATAQLQVVGAERVTWRDGSLGCPKPGMLYSQSLLPGWRVRLQVGGEVWTYHAGDRGAPVLCPADRAQEPLQSSTN